MAAVSSQVYRLLASETLPAIPLLTAAGYVLAESAAAERLVRFFRALFGWMPGGVRGDGRRRLRDVHDLHRRLRRHHHRARRARLPDPPRATATRRASRWAWSPRRAPSACSSRPASR